ncbi:hypothetical protein RDWZM_001255 [Blomia tropicalis]|uniref:DNA-directed RNA polymerase subunit n=1 Tax=Blomia tropicalis TaxID=40697 RepID=A0A9Q0MFP4_BLOTA|nr:hypothetical protein RDWZM_001255 [Blomia tropicalis]
MASSNIAQASGVVPQLNHSYGVESVGAKSLTCATCYKDAMQCVGHFGSVELCYPVYHVGYFSYTMEILQSICKRCANVLLSYEQRNKYMIKLVDDLNPLAKKIVHKEIIALCKKVKTCPHCDSPNGLIKKFGFLKIFHLTKAVNSVLVNRIFEANKATVEEIQEYFGSSCEFLSPHTVLKLFEKIPKTDYIFLLLLNNTPMDLICTYIPVPPCIIRPSSHNTSGVRSTEDELTMKLNEILIANESLKKRIQDGSIFIQVMDTWDFLQVLVSVYINSDVRNLPPQHSSVASGQGVAQRLKGKEGRFRANLSGKRVNYSARTVISPDPNLGIDEVGIPLKIASHMTYPVHVAPFNIDLMRQLVLNGPKAYPGAVLLFKKDGSKKFLSFVDRKVQSRKLEVGDIVYRHMLNGDYVLFNRQPSLHRLSIMCHRVRVHPDQTFKFNECVCSPYNADFDGDEMNVHFMQYEEAKAEAASLMQSKQNMTSPRNGEPVIAPIQDFITSIYLMTCPNAFFTKYEVCQIISNLMSVKDVKKRIIIPKPAIIKPFPVWTGKQLFSIILKPFKETKVNLNLIYKSKAYTGGKGRYQNEMYIHIRNSEHISGTIDKSVIGGGSKKNIFYLILKQYDSDNAIETMLRLCRVSSFFLTNRGFSIGIDDVTPNEALKRQKAQLVESGYSKVNEYIDAFNQKTLSPITGLTQEQTLESLILKELSDIRDHAGQACIKELRTTSGKKNAPMIMAKSGAKGSYINVSQMAVCVGQQSIRGQRVGEGFSNRVLPHFQPGEKGPKAKGFVANSFWSGLDPYEFFFHAMAGREGLLDTAVKTAETGYMQRRLVKGLEDLVVHYDYSVRNSNGEVIQFNYGDDSIDPINIEASELVIDLSHYWNHILAQQASVDNRLPILSAEQMNNFIDAKIDSCLKIPDFYRTKIKDFLYQESQNLFSAKYTQLAPIVNVTEWHLEQFLQRIETKFVTAKIDPGTAIGAICAQSIGEPTTQMTLKTFHFTGVASMNITQGVPRITEIINATKVPSTPFIYAELIDSKHDTAAEKAKLLIEQVYLDQICKKIYQCQLDGKLCYILHLNDELCRLQLNLNESSLRDEIMSQLKPDECEIYYPYVKIFPSIKRMIYLPKVFEYEISQVCVSGNRQVERVTIREDKGKYYLMVEGNGFLNVLGTTGINHRTSTSNNIHEVASVLGIEASRSTIISEIKSTMSNHGITIDERHLMLLADTMTASGYVVGMTRAGFSKVKSSTIKMASFERTIDNLYQASYYNNKDDLLGASECIIVGAPTKMGTGFFDIIPDMTSKTIDYKKYKRTFIESGVDF